MSRRIAIIGGGAAAATVLIELLERQTPHALHLDWYTGGRTPGRGVAYQTLSPRHLLNVRAASMSMFTGKPRGFLDFLKQDDPTIQGTDFVPRHRYGDYLDAEIARLQKRHRTHGHDVNIIPFAVDAVVPETNRVTVIHGERSRPADAAVLALGALPPRPLPGVDSKALARGRYVVDPWPLLANPAVQQPAPEHIVVLGLGLTAIDVIVELAARWPQARFTAISRHGLLPEAHLARTAAPPDDSAELVAAMHDVPDIRHWMHLLRDAITEQNNWRPTLDSLRPHIPELWTTLSPEHRARFLRHVRWAWDRARHRMPPQIDTSIRQLQAEGRLQCLRGRMHSVQGDESKLQLQLGHADQSRTLHADLVIQATGLDTDAAQSPHRLIEQLLTNGHVIADPFGLGLQTDDVGRLHHHERIWPNFYAIGSLRRGTSWESTAMPEISQQAQRITDQLLGA